MASMFRPIALVVEDDEMQRSLVSVLFEESEIGVIACESAEEALRVLAKFGDRLSLMFADVRLSGDMDGIELACIARRRYPDLYVIVTSGSAVPRELPEGARFMAKPWLALDLLREAERVRH